MPPLNSPSRRDLFAAAAALGIGTASFHRALANEAAVADPPGPVTAEMIENAEWVAGFTLEDEDRAKIATSMTRALQHIASLHTVAVGNNVPPAIHFLPDLAEPQPRRVRRTGNSVSAPRVEVARPAADEDLAFLTLSQLAELVRTKKVSSLELTKLYLGRLKQYDPVLKCVISLTEELALKQAARADRALAGGTYLGPLHGIPWAAKDLIAYPGYKTTWGAGHFKDQSIDAKATVAARLGAAGAVLSAKTTLGALAMGDVWYGGKTRNPWQVRQGSSGSSAGSAASVAAGLVGFAIGSETMGSIISPCTRCGVTGLRPTFGRVSRHGCMTLAWSMDKIGPIARSVADCALIFSAIHGSDGRDPTATDRPFEWPCRRELSHMRVGYVAGKINPDEREELKVLKDLGVTLVPIRLPDALPARALDIITTVEASAAFDDLTRAGVGEGIGAWAATFRTGRFIPAVDYLRAQRVRTLLMREMAKVMETVDLYVGGNDLFIANMTGLPTVVVPNGLRKGTPIALTFTGRLWGESELLAVAQAYQDATGHHLKRPPMDKVTVEEAEKK